MQVIRSSLVQGVEKWIVLLGENSCTVTLHNVWIPEEAELGPFVRSIRALPSELDVLESWFPLYHVTYAHLNWEAQMIPPSNFSFQK